MKNYLTPEIDVRRGDVLSAWSGIRPLVKDPNAEDTQSLGWIFCCSIYKLTKRVCPMCKLTKLFELESAFYLFTALSKYLYIILDVELFLHTVKDCG